MIDQARELVRGADRLVAFSGAGLSAESGLATFRDAATAGVWREHDPMRLASPQGFADDPVLVTEWYAERRRTVARAEPNPAHRALAARPDVVNVTQNVDDLLERAGAQRITRLHGTLTHDRCHGGCGHEELVDLADPPGLRECPECGAPMRPAVVWFGETLPGRAWAEAERVCTACDVMLVIGTSALVYPAAGLIELARVGGARTVVVNTEESGAGAAADVELRGAAGELLPELLA